MNCGRRPTQRGGHSANAPARRSPECGRERSPCSDHGGCSGGGGVARCFDPSAKGDGRSRARPRDHRPRLRARAERRRHGDGRRVGDRAPAAGSGSRTPTSACSSPSRRSSPRSRRCRSACSPTACAARGRSAPRSLLWSVAMFWSAIVSNFNELLLARLFLGVVTAAAGPLVASLVGDYFPALGARPHLRLHPRRRAARRRLRLRRHRRHRDALVAGGVRRARGSGARARAGSSSTCRSRARRDRAARQRRIRRPEAAKEEAKPSDAHQLAREHGIEPDPALVLARRRAHRLRRRGHARAARAHESRPDRRQRVRLLLPRRHPDVRLRVREGAVPDQPGIRERAAAARRRRRGRRRARRRLPRRLARAQATT